MSYGVVVKKNKNTKKATSCSIDRVALCRRQILLISWPELLVATQTSVVVQATIFVLSSGCAKTHQCPESMGNAHTPV